MKGLSCSFLSQVCPSLWSGFVQLSLGEIISLDAICATPLKSRAGKSSFPYHRMKVPILRDPFLWCAGHVIFAQMLGS